MFCKRQYRKKVKCTACKKELYSDYTANHLKRLHGNDKSVEFVIANDDSKQKKKTFAFSSEGISSTSKLPFLPTENEIDYVSQNTASCTWPLTDAVPDSLSASCVSTSGCMTRISVSDSQIDTIVCSCSTYTSISNSVFNSTNALTTTGFSTANYTYKTTADNAILNSFISATALSSGCDSTAIDAKSKSCIPTGILDCVSLLIYDVCDSVCASNIVSETINPDAAQESCIVTCASSYCVSVSADVVSKADFANSSTNP